MKEGKISHPMTIHPIVAAAPSPAAGGAYTPSCIL